MQSRNSPRGCTTLLLAGLLIFLAGVAVGASLQSRGAMPLPRARATPTTPAPVAVPRATPQATDTPRSIPTPTATRTPAPTPTPEELGYHVVTLGANVRPCPETNERCRPVAELRQCDIVRVDPLSTADEWLVVFLEDHEGALYMHRSVLAPGTCAAPEPTPTSTPVG